MEDGRNYVENVKKLNYIPIYEQRRRLECRLVKFTVFELIWANPNFSSHSITHSRRGQQ